MKPGKSHFSVASSKRRSCLRDLCQALVYRIPREQMTHMEFLEARNAIYDSPVYARSTQEARRAVNRYLDGAVEMLFATEQIVWKHRTPEGEWCYEMWDSRKHGNPEDSRHVWRDTNKVWFERTPEGVGDSGGVQ